MSLFPVPYPSLGALCAVRSDYAVQEQTRQQAKQHTEVMGALKELGEGRVAVSVLAAEIRPAAEAAVSYLAPQAAAYNTSIAEWYVRYFRVRDKLRERKKRHEASELKRLESDYRARIEQWKSTATWWIFPNTDDDAKKALEKEGIFDPADRRSDYAFKRYMRVHFELDPYREMYCASRPQKPEGYDDLSELRELTEATSLCSGAMLTIPAKTAAKVAKWAAKAVVSG